MDNYLEIYAHWYPRSYGLSDYPMECHVTYSGAERKALFEQLTEAQQALVNQQRKYEVRSQPIKMCLWSSVKISICH